MTKRLLFTGAGGFIGRQAAPYLLERGYEVHAVDIRPIVLEGCEVHTADLMNASDAKRLDRERSANSSAAHGVVCRARKVLDVAR